MLSLSLCLSPVFSPSLKSCLQLSQPLHSSPHGHLAPRDHFLAAFDAVVDPSFLSPFPQYGNSSWTSPAYAEDWITPSLGCSATFRTPLCRLPLAPRTLTGEAPMTRAPGCCYNKRERTHTLPAPRGHRAGLGLCVRPTISGSLGIGSKKGVGFAL